MRILYLDCFSGISGDMTVAALLDLGISETKFRAELEKLGLEGYSIEISKKLKCGIMGTDFDVQLHHHHHDHEHEHDHEHDHEHEHTHEHEHRNLFDIENMIERSALSPYVKNLSKNIFREVAVAEASVHGKTIEEVHFHEVGAVDSIVDIVGAAICLELLAVDGIYASALHDGQGTIECAHGTMPVPVPAVMAMFKDSGIPLVIEDVQTELITPTGMAIVKTIAQSFGKMPNIEIEALGYGLGKRDTGKFNALRAVVGETGTRALKEKVVVIESNIDNTTAEIMGFTVEKLLDAGALDVYQIPIQMKKNRAGTLLGVICKDGEDEKFAQMILSETGSIGVRTFVCERFILDRTQITVETKFGTARAKIAGNAPNAKIAPEFEDCKKLAKTNEVPIRKIYDAIISQAQIDLNNGEINC